MNQPYSRRTQFELQRDAALRQKEEEEKKEGSNSRREAGYKKNEAEVWGLFVAFCGQPEALEETALWKLKDEVTHIGWYEDWGKRKQLTYGLIAAINTCADI